MNETARVALTQGDVVGQSSGETLGAAITRDFVAAALKAQRRAHEAGRPYSTMDRLDRVVFVHPDGSVRLSREASSLLAT